MMRRRKQFPDAAPAAAPGGSRFGSGRRRRHGRGPPQARAHELGCGFPHLAQSDSDLVNGCFKRFIPLRGRRGLLPAGGGRANDGPRTCETQARPAHCGPPGAHAAVPCFRSAFAASRSSAAAAARSASARSRSSPALSRGGCASAGGGGAAAGGRGGGGGGAGSGEGVSSRTPRKGDKAPSAGLGALRRRSEGPDTELSERPKPADEAARDGATDGARSDRLRVGPSRVDMAGGRASE